MKVRRFETDLERYFRSVNADRVEMDESDDDALPESLNDKGGDGGRLSGQPHHYVYVAVKRIG